MRHLRASLVPALADCKAVLTGTEKDKAQHLLRERTWSWGRKTKATTKLRFLHVRVSRMLTCLNQGGVELVVVFLLALKCSKIKNSFKF